MRKVPLICVRCGRRMGEVQAEEEVDKYFAYCDDCWRLILKELRELRDREALKR